jgi:hypothetical protein
VRGNKTYETIIGGSKTVAVLDAIDVEAAKQAWKVRGK